MKTNITQEMLNEFNDAMKVNGSIIRLKFSKSMSHVVDIVPNSMCFIDSFIINPDKQFYKMMEEYFKEKGIEKLSYNNTGGCFW
jgi:hypothetical protein